VLVRPAGELGDVGRVRALRGLVRLETGLDRRQLRAAGLLLRVVGRTADREHDDRGQDAEDDDDDEELDEREALLRKALPAPVLAAARVLQHWTSPLPAPKARRLLLGAQPPTRWLRQEVTGGRGGK